ncbi:MAG: hypothetical protein LBR13_06090 [Dysgonamonadaceae bacterium]|nr:hypothetical protein [Dysgonamonadaceae bacterium]
MKMDNVLLITGAIDMAEFDVPYTIITDTELRLNEYLKSLQYAIDNYTTVRHIVFCENTAFQYDYSELIKRAEKQNKTLEIISFKGSYDKISFFGKGWGEGEIVQKALSESNALSNAATFFKLTGRLCVANMDKVVKTTANDTAFMFLPELKRKQTVYTAFYKVDTAFYKHVLLDAYKEVNDAKKHYLEEAFFDRLMDIPITSFGVFPYIIGISGTSGEKYTPSRLGFLKACLYNKLGFFSKK